MLPSPPWFTFIRGVLNKKVEKEAALAEAETEVDCAGKGSVDKAEQSQQDKLVSVTHFKTVGQLIRHARVYYFGSLLPEGLVLSSQLLQLSFDRTKRQLQFVFVQPIRANLSMATQRWTASTVIKSIRYEVRFFSEQHFLTSQIFYFLFRALKFHQNVLGQLSLV